MQKDKVEIIGAGEIAYGLELVILEMSDGIARGYPNASHLRISSHTQDYARSEAILLVQGIDNVVILNHIDAATICTNVNIAFML